MSFFAELRRRNVFKVAVAYAIVAWLLIQITSTVAPALHLPDWTLTFIVYLTVIGFPLAMFLAWAYELTPEGVKATPSAGPAQYHTRTTGQRLNYFILGVLVLVVAFIVVDNYVLVDKSATVTSVAGRGGTINTDEETKAATDILSSLQISHSPSGRVRRHYQVLGLTHPLAAGALNAYVALSPNGGSLVYAANIEGKEQIYVRDLYTLTTHTISNIGATHIFLSPDGKWVGSMTLRSLQKFSILGGSPQPLFEGEISNNRGGFWAADNMIYFVLNQKLYRIAANGGKPERVNINSDLKDFNQTWPSDLPGSKNLLLTVSQSFNLQNANVALLSLATGETKILIQNGYNARYVPTGHIVFMRSGSLWAVPFDVTTMTTTGPEVPVVNGVQTSSFYGKAVYAFSDDGLLVYLPGKDVGVRGSSQRQLVWVNRQGNETPLAVKADNYAFPRLSPDETRVAVVIGFDESAEIWNYDLNRKLLSRRTFSGNAHAPLWTPDGMRLVYTFYPKYQGLAWVKADGTGQPKKLIDAPRLLHPSSFTPDGSQLIYFEALSGPNDVYAMTLSGKRTEQPLLTSKFDEWHPALSPDGHWLAYDSNETGQSEIYVRPYPNIGDGKWQVSTNGGYEPHWRGDGKELFYRQGQNPFTMMAVPVETAQGFQSGTPNLLFTGDFYVHDSGISYDVTADGQRFLMLKPVQETNDEGKVASQEINLVAVENWFEELKRLAPPAVIRK